jgi:hypothetical protein
MGCVPITASLNLLTNFAYVIRKWYSRSSALPRPTKLRAWQENSPGIWLQTPVVVRKLSKNIDFLACLNDKINRPAHLLPPIPISRSFRSRVCNPARAHVPPPC